MSRGVMCKDVLKQRSKGSWEITIDIGRDGQGKRLRKIQTIKGKKADAERRLREVVTAYDKGFPITIQKIAVAQWMDRWLRDYVSPNTRQRTTEHYDGVVREHIVPHIGHIELTRLAPKDIQSLGPSCCPTDCLRHRLNWSTMF